MFPAPIEKSSQQKRILYYLSVSVVLLLWLIPLMIISLAAFKTADQLNAGGRGFVLPEPFTLIAFKTIFTNGPFMSSIFNSFVVVISVTIISISLATMAGYALSKFRFKGMMIIFAIFVGGNFIPYQILMIPVLRLTQDIGIWNTKYALILFHGAFQAGFCIFFMRNFISQIPNELIESARVDGANELTIFYKIVLPLVRPAMAALGVLIFSFVWNDFFWSLILSPISPSGMLAPAGLATIIKGRFYNEYNVMAVGSILVALPPVVLFFLLQKQFISGLTMGATKG